MSWAGAGSRAGRFTGRAARVTGAAVAAPRFDGSGAGHSAMTTGGTTSAGGWAWPFVWEGTTPSLAARAGWPGRALIGKPGWVIGGMMQRGGEGNRACCAHTPALSRRERTSTGTGTGTGTAERPQSQ
ncbi:hypothetical protein GCM10027072_09380 [Streptomyces bullii]